VEVWECARAELPVAQGGAGRVPAKRAQGDKAKKAKRRAAEERAKECARAREAWKRPPKNEL